jgi:hypothetical protein
MAEKGKTPAKKKAYKKPSADRLGDGDLKGVTGGGGKPDGFVLLCRNVGGAAITPCETGGAATGPCSAGGAATGHCNAGSTPM